MFTSNRRLTLLSCFAFALAIAEGTAYSNSADLPIVLRNMPTNSDQRCVGIVAVAEALLEGQPLDETANADDVERLAGSIFRNLATDEPCKFPRKLEIDGKLEEITSPAALKQLSTRVAELYKQETNSILQTPDGEARLQRAQRQTLATKQALINRLESDADKTEFFCCFGERRFPDGTYKTTSHAVLFRKFANGDLTVFDPNDPGRPIECKLSESSGILTAEWSCRYRDTGDITWQRYVLVPKQTFFRIARNTD